MKVKSDVQKLEDFESAQSGYFLDPLVACMESSRWLLLALWWRHQQLERRGTQTPVHQEGAVSAPL